MATVEESVEQRVDSALMKKALDAGIGTITLDNAAKHNALNAPHVHIEPDSAPDTMIVEAAAGMSLSGARNITSNRLCLRPVHKSLAVSNFIGGSKCPAVLRTAR